jgi:serine protease Do
LSKAGDIRNSTHHSSRSGQVLCIDRGNANRYDPNIAMVPGFLSLRRSSAIRAMAMTSALLTPLTGYGLEELPEPTETEVISELQRVQSQVQRHFAEARRAVVAVETGDGTASGVIVSPTGLIMTAAHVTEEPKKKIFVVLDNGRKVTARTLGLDTSTDAGLVQLTGNRKNWPHVELAGGPSATTAGDWCFALGHPGGYAKERGVVMRVGKVVKRTANTLHTDCVLMGGDSGGPLFNLEGRLIGIHSLIWEGRDQNVHVSLAPFLRSWDAMLASEVIRTWARGNGAYLGVATRMSDAVELEIVEVLDASPAQEAGLRPGDIIVSVDQEAITDQPQFSGIIRDHRAGDRVQIMVKRDDDKQPRRLNVILGSRVEDESER